MLGRSTESRSPGLETLKGKVQNVYSEEKLLVKGTPETVARV